MCTFLWPPRHPQGDGVREDPIEKEVRAEARHHSEWPPLELPGAKIRPSLESVPRPVDSVHLIRACRARLITYVDDCVEAELVLFETRVSPEPGGIHRFRMTHQIMKPVADMSDNESCPAFGCSSSGAHH